MTASEGRGGTLMRKAWYLRRVGFPRAWQITAPRARGLKIGLLDSGLDLSHPLLQPCLGASLNLVEPGAPVWDDAGHGTAVAGLIIRATGTLHPELLPVKVLDGRVEGRVSAVVRGLYWCAEQGCDLINLSFGAGRRELLSLREAVEALERAGVLLIAAAGNGRAVELPGALDSVLAVGAIGPNDRLGRYSARGSGLSLLAPGVSIPVDLPEGGRMQASGTSLAAPLVTAAAALLLGSEPALRPAAMRERLTESAEWLPWLGQAEQGAGLLRADNVLSGRPRLQIEG
jgi:subtilisin